MNRPKDQGTRFETWLLRYLSGAGLNARRLAPAGLHDGGDIELVDGHGDVWRLEAKDRERLNIHQELAAIVSKAETAGALPALIWQRRILKAGNSRRTTLEPVVILPLSVWRSGLVDL